MRFVTRRKFIGVAALSGVGVASLSAHDQLAGSAEAGPAASSEASEHFAAPDGDRMTEEIQKEKIRRAMLAGPSIVTSEATVAEMDQRHVDIRSKTKARTKFVLF